MISLSISLSATCLRLACLALSVQTPVITLVPSRSPKIPRSLTSLQCKSLTSHLTHTLPYFHLPSTYYVVCTLYPSRQAPGPRVPRVPRVPRHQDPRPKTQDADMSKHVPPYRPGVVYSAVSRTAGARLLASGLATCVGTCFPWTRTLPTPCRRSR